MISLSSIVKAKLLTYVPRCSDYSTDYAKTQTTETVAEPPATDDYGMIERQENILNQAIKKSHHIESEAQNRADSLIENALKNSREIMNEAEKKGYEEGYLRGLVDGANASEQAAEEGLSELRRLIEQFNSEQKEALKRQEKDLIEIAFELAKKIMKHHVKTDEEAVYKMLEEMIQENESSIKIYLSEYQRTLDVHIDKTAAKKLKSISKDIKVVIVKGEDLIMSENEGGVIDMSVPAQLEQLKKVIDHTY